MYIPQKTDSVYWWRSLKSFSVNWRRRVNNDNNNNNENNDNNSNNNNNNINNNSNNNS